MSTLYEITGNFIRLLEMAEEEEISEEALADTLESLEYDLAEKADQYAKIIGHVLNLVKIVLKLNI